ncbi:ZIP family metal transporter [Thermoflavimicrobium dichotomicum]|uniref:Zinc transporter, ZIP family n=1 Tax=Thermoflavimicrobium dichotomicum TaxID=46223 RepID=A0A1I3K324_9BACL|nr:ZIP family metal transporter [Thermoflavimicrobium dichotomicum]SFI66873.1 zinc transporter, ZIP family [Thermoflavimicrobium dichotomicum]
MVSVMNQAMWVSSLAGLSTLMGVLLVFFVPVTQRVFSFIIGFSSGILLFISFAFLLPLSIKYGNLSQIFAGMGLALFFLWLLHLLPFCKVERKGNTTDFFQLSVLLFLAILAHHIPEGIAIGMGFEIEHQVGFSLALALAMHNIPEGMGLAMTLRSTGQRPFLFISLIFVCVISLPVGTGMGLLFVQQSPELIAIGFSFAFMVVLWMIYEIGKHIFSFYLRMFVHGLWIGGIFMYIIHQFH